MASVARVFGDLTMTRVNTRSNTPSFLWDGEANLQKNLKMALANTASAQSHNVTTENCSLTSPARSLLERSPQSTLVVIDTRVTDAQLLALGMCEEATTLVLTLEQNGVEQITQYLWEHPLLNQLVILAHGQPGTIFLGATALSSENSHHYQRDWDAWSHQLQQIGLFSCRVAADDVGRNFLESLYQQTGLAIAASSRPVGSAAKGGTWELDVQVGGTEPINVVLPLNPQVQASYGGLLGTLTVNSLDDTINSGDGQVTLREAIAAANADGITDLGEQASGVDTIVFDSSLEDGTIALSLGELLIDSSAIIDGSTAPGLVISGGGASRVFRFTSGVSTLDAVEITGGSDTDGAGIRVEDAALTVQNSLLTGNNDAGSGGAIYANNANLTVTNTTITGNTAANFGGGMTLINGTDAIVTFSTIARNQGSGIDRVDDSTLDIGHTLLADNTRGNIPLGIQNTTSLNYNLTDDITLGLNQSGDRILVSDTLINLGILSDNGGPTRTLAPLPGSIVINGGDSTSTIARDQRGVLRPVDSRLDIGAFEAALPIVTVDALTTNDSTPGLTGTVTLPGGIVDESLVVNITIGNTDYDAVNNGDGTWTIQNDIIDPLDDDTYDVQVSATNVSGTGTDNTSSELVIDTAAPDVAINPLSTNDRTPDLSGTVSDPDATVVVSIAGVSYEAINNGDNTWILPGESITTPLEDQTYDVVVAAADVLGNEGFDTTQDELTIDSQAPEVTINAESLVTNDATPSLTGFVDDPSAKIAVTINRVSYIADVGSDGTWTLPDDLVDPPLIDGDYEVVVAATDEAGNISTATDTLTVDTEPPTIAINPLVTADTTPDLSGTVSGDPALIEITIDGNSYEATSNGDGTWSLDGDAQILTALEDRTYDVSARAIDEAGNEGTDTSVDELVVDTTAPEVTVTPLLTNDSTPTLVGTVSDQNGAIAVTVTISDVSYDATINEDNTWSIDIPDPIPDGTYDVVVSATDSAGNEGSDASTNELAIDTISPMVTVDKLVTSDTTPELTGRVDDSNAITRVTVTLDGEEYTAEVSEDGTWVVPNDTIITPLLDNTYDIEVEAEDSFGNVGTDDTTDDLVIDSTPPTIAIDSITTNDSTPELTGTVDDDDADISITVNGQTYQASNNQDGTWTLADDILPELADSTYDVIAEAVDEVGNSGVDTTQDELVVDTVAPAITLEDINTNNSTPTLSGSIDDPGAVIQITIDREQVGNGINNGDIWTFTLPSERDDGVYSVEVSAADAATNVGTDTATLTIDTVDPVVTVDELRTNDNTPDLTGTISEEDAEVKVTIAGVSYDAVSNGDGTWLLAGDAFEPSGLDDGTYDISVLATDKVGNTGTDESTDELFIDTQAPMITVETLVTNNRTPELSGTITDPDALVQVTVGRNTYDVTPTDTTWVLPEGTINPPLEDGTYDVLVTAADSVNNIGTDESTDELFVDGTPPTVTVDFLLTTETSPALTGTIDDAMATVQVTVDGITYDATNNGDTWVLPAGTFPDLVDDSYDIEVTATDALGNVGTDDSTPDLVVDTTAPVVTVDGLDTNDNTPILTGTLDDPTATLDITVGGAPFTVTAIANNTWEFELPTALDDGTYDISATATDEVGNTSTDDTSDELFIDTVAPQLTVNSILTSDARPPLSGAVNDPDAVVQVGIGAQLLAATNNGDGTWSIQDNAITPALPEGVLDIKAIATDSVGNVGNDSTLNEVVIDITAPAADIVDVAPDPSGPVGAIAINFSEAVSGLDVSDFTLTRDGVPVSLAGAILQSGNGVNWSLGNLASLTTLTANYALTLRAAGTGIRDTAGNLLLSGAGDSWSVQNFTVDGLNPPATINGQVGSASPIDFSGGNRGVNLSGNGSNDRLKGTNDRDRLKGKGGNDRLFGKRKNDRLFGDNGDDRLFGNGGNDRLEGNNGDDRLEGGAGRDRLEGGNGSDRILGGRGSDLIIGGGGSDRLTGNGGRDVFAIENLTDGVDTITDFNPTEDVIDVSGILRSPQFAAVSSFAKVNQFVRLNQIGSDTQVSIDADGNGSGNILQPIVVLQGVNANAIVSTNVIA